MNMRKIAVVGGFAVGAALASAPIASADDLTSIVDSEISLSNSIFDTEAALAGDSANVVPGTTGQPFDTISLLDAPHSGTPTLLDFELYGLNPIANSASDPGSYNVFNGALTEFDDAFNSEAYGLLNNNALVPEADLFGSDKVIDAALGTGSDTGAATTFFEAGLADLQGYFDIPSLSGASTLSDLGGGLDLTSLLDPGSLGDGLTGLLGDLGSLGGGLL
jgi:hypothetical protein